MLGEHGAEPEYFEVVDPASMAPVDALAGELLLVTAARVGAVRLIDNVDVRAAVPGREPSEQSTREAVPCSA